MFVDRDYGGPAVVEANLAPELPPLPPPPAEIVLALMRELVATQEQERERAYYLGREGLGRICNCVPGRHQLLNQ